MKLTTSELIAAISVNLPPSDSIFATSEDRLLKMAMHEIESLHNP
jgi:hypothetical protein